MVNVHTMDYVVILLCFMILSNPILFLLITYLIKNLVISKNNIPVIINPNILGAPFSSDRDKPIINVILFNNL